MAQFLGIDTSNYTTSAAVYDTENGMLFSEKQLLPVAEQELGLRQSDAVFAHVKQLPKVVARLTEGRRFSLKAACVSTRPRSQEGSYMPAFLVGKCAAELIGHFLGIPVYSCSHQEGHILAALYSAQGMELLNHEFYAFHVSGGTTECLLVRPDEELFSVELIARTLDLNAGQLIDRVGRILGLAFPSGMELDRLAVSCKADFPKPKPAFRGLDCHFSGAENQCRDLLAKGLPREAVARYAVEYVGMAVEGMTQRVLAAYGDKPLLYAGGVMSNSLISKRISEKYGGRFAEPRFSSDNASGPAILAAMKYGAVEW